MNTPDTPNCNKCKNFFVTWDPRQPYGCRAMAFKSKRLPALEVLQASGHNCLRFEFKEEADSDRSEAKRRP